MIFNSIKSEIARHVKNLPGWRTNRKIVVFESDDWGSIRMPSKEVYYACLQAGYAVDKNIYEKTDALESEDDLELLFDLLKKFRDVNGNHPIITANCIVANPDFDKISGSSFREYHYELVTETFKKYPAHANGFNLWKQGLNERIFYPQFHGREHLNVGMFMEALHQNDSDIKFAIKHRMPGIMRLGSSKRGNYYVEATMFKTESAKKEILSIILDGLRIFKDMFGYFSESIIPPNYTWSMHFNKSVADLGVKYFQGYRKIREPGINGNEIRFHTRQLGEFNQFGQLYLIRNGSFEPSLNYGKDTVNRCMQDIAAAFRLNKPAIISTHRINFSGWIEPENRNKTLVELEELLRKILNKWPGVEFMTSDKLGELIRDEKRKSFLHL
ncbi:hypothetical protein TBC1_12815 [Lentimicrobium saccharophilum]|uniref:Uncharacterized protein n=2 Tax=Lentimicrobium saccharophilum TaxID=1678841 RepID=A0A0S7C2C3_9BACT|nr:hypothetical protein TBC1_12815 [Lentimicrobium saccharophilum]